MEAQLVRVAEAINSFQSNSEKYRWFCSRLVLGPGIVIDMIGIAPYKISYEGTWRCLSSPA